MVTVKNGTQCTATATVSVIVDALPTANATGTTVCAGTEIKVNVTPTFTAYSWTGVDNFKASTQNPLVNVSATAANNGTYQVTVTDANGCTAIATTSITVKALPTVTATGTTICNGGTGTISASGADTYTWTGPAPFTATGANPTVNTGGLYTVIGTNTLGCSATATANVSVSPITLIPPVVNKVCKGASVTLETTATATGKDWVWTPDGATTPTITVTATANANYKVSFADKVSGCKFIADINIEVIENPVPVIEKVDSLCIGQVIKLKVNGTATDKFSWTGPGFTSTEQNPTVGLDKLPTTASTYTYGVTVTSTGGCTGTATVSVVIKPSPTVGLASTEICAGATKTLTATGNADKFLWSRVPAGTFTSTTKDLSISEGGLYTVTGFLKGCTATATATVVINPLPTATASATSPVCVGGKIEFTATGGGTYAWNGPDNFKPTVAQPSIAAADKAKHEGVYTVTVTSDKGCTATATTSVFVNTNPNPTPTSNGKVCVGDTIKLSVTAGTTYSWKGDKGYSSTVQEPKIVSTEPGTFVYTVTVSGAGGCTGTATTSVVVNALPTANATGTTVCAGNEVKLNVTPTFTSYAWTGVGTFTSSIQNPTVAANATSAINGTYKVVVTDANGCTAIATTSVTVKPLPTVSVTPVTLCAGATGTLTANTNADTYSWSSSVSGFNATTKDVSVSQAGTYTVIVTKDGCTALASTTVEVKPSITLTVSTASICAGTTGNVEVKGADTYTWTGPGTFTATGANPVVSAQGTYTVIGTSGGCTASATTSVTVKPNPTVSLPSIAICAGATGTLSANSNATQFLWKSENPNAVFTSTTKDLSVTEAGIYTVGAFLNGCSATATASVIIKPLPTVTVASITLCAGATGTLSANTNADSYSWSSSVASFNATTKDVSVTQAGTYTVIVTKDGCTATTSTTVTVNDKPNPQITQVTPKCIGESIGLTVSGGTGNTYSWTGSDNFTSSIQNPTVTPLPTKAGTYTYAVTVSGTGGCTGTATISVVVKPNPALTITPAISICAGDKRTLTASGADTYSWTGGGFTATTASIEVTTQGVYSVIGHNQCNG
jgi:hypothetical protein